MSATPRPRDGRDCGSILPMILVFMVIGSLIVIPMLSYASTVLRANGVSVQKTETMEQLRAGARVASANPADLFELCDSGGYVAIPEVAGLVPGTSSSCRQVSNVAVLDELEVPYGGVAMQLGESVPTGFSYTTAQPNAGDPVNWYGDPANTTCDATQRWCPDPQQDTIWLPPLPEVASSQQEATGHPMPEPRDCTVYFPGTYNDPVVLDRPTYFVSGVYLFKNDVTVVGGADVVMGFGLAEGCVGNDAAAVLDMYPNPLPPDLNAEGNGATLIFAGEARLVIDDTLMTADRTSRSIVANSAARPLRFEINQRYIKDVSDTAARVSILSVNGDRDVDESTLPATVTYGPLDVPDVITMAESVVKTSTGALELAHQKGMDPSSLTAEARPPEAPKNVTALSLDDDLWNPIGKGAARISWDPPVGNDEGGNTIKRYVVTEATRPWLTCATDGATNCLVRDLDHNVDYYFSVVAINDLGESDPSLPAYARTSGPLTDLTGPSEPQNVTVVDPATTATPYDRAVEVTWDAPAWDGNGVLVGYQVNAYRVYQNDLTLDEEVEPTPVGSCEVGAFRDEAAPTSCVIENLDPLDLTPGMGPLNDPLAIPPLTSTWLGYVFQVTAYNAVTNDGVPFTMPDPSVIIDSEDAPLTDPPVQTVTGAGTTPYTAPALPTWPIAPTYVPDPIVDVNLAGGPSSVVTIAGYVATPQGRLRVHNPAGDPVSLTGGVVAGSYDIDATTLATMGTVGSPTSVGFENVVLQRTVEIVTVIPGERITSTLRAQINANGADMVVNSWVIQ